MPRSCPSLSIDFSTASDVVAMTIRKEKEKKCKRKRSFDSPHKGERKEEEEKLI